MFLRSCAIAIAALMLSACAGGSSYADSYERHIRYPKDAFGHDAHIATKRKHYHPAQRAVTCDRVRDVCYDRYGLSYYATVRYLGSRLGDRAYKRYGDQVFLFSPTQRVICDRRTDSCSALRRGHANRGNYGYGNGSYQPWWGHNTGQPSWQQPQYPQHQQPHWRWSNNK